jgi:hypothetical protein
MYEKFISNLFISNSIKYIIIKIYYQIQIYYNKDNLIYNCQIIINKYTNYQRKQINKNIDELLFIISLQIILRQILNILDNNCKIQFNYSYVSNFNCNLIIQNLLLDNFIFYNKFLIDISTINKHYYNLWLQSNDDIINHEEYNQKYHTYLENIKELIFKLYHAYYILTDRFNFLIK